MYKFIPQFSARLVATLPLATTTMQLSPTDAAFLAAQLSGGAWTYVAFAEDSYREVVRITAVSGNNASIVRGVDGTTARTWNTNDCFVSVLGPSAVLDLVTQAGVNNSLSIAGAGATTVTQPTPRNFVVTTPPVSIAPCEGEEAIQVLGAFPNFCIALDRSALGANCGNAPAPEPPPLESGELITGSGAANVTYDPLSGAYNIDFAPITISGGPNIAVSGSYPNFVISYTGTVGSPGTVLSVSGSAGISITGIPTSTPVVSLTNTGVVSGNYAGFAVDAQGRITAMPVAPGTDSGPVMALALFSDQQTLGSISLSRAGHTVTLRAQAASTAPDGWGVVRLAAPTLPETRDAGDSTRAVSPAGLDAALVALRPTPPNGLVGTSTGESPSAYTVTAASTATNVNAGESLLILATMTVVHSTTPTTSVGEFGMAVFVDGTVVTSTRIVPGNTHTLMARIASSPSPLRTIELRHTILGAGFTPSTAQLTHILVKD
jgi:hypothetical protein